MKRRIRRDAYHLGSGRESRNPCWKSKKRLGILTEIQYENRRE